MCNEEEIPSWGHSDTAVDGCARLDVTIALLIGSLLVCRVEAIMMVLAHNNEGDLGYISKDLCASSSDSGYLLTQHDLVLAFGHPYKAHLVLVGRP